MSVVAHTLAAGKRHFEDSEGLCPSDRHYSGPAPKRFCRGHIPVLSGENHQLDSDLNTLLQLFGDMDAKVVEDVYLNISCNLEAAIKKLGDLRLTKQEEAAAEAVAAATVLSAVGDSEESPEIFPQGSVAAAHSLAPHPADSSPSYEASPSSAVPLPLSVSPLDDLTSSPAFPTFSPPSPFAPAAAGAGEAPASVSATAAAVMAAAASRSAAAWVDLVISEVAGATDVDDARKKVSNVLQELEQQVTLSAAANAANADAQGAAQGGGPGVAGGPAEVSLQRKVTELVRENVFLKKAVQIQHKQAAEMRQERVLVTAEMRALREQIDIGKERMRQLEVANYSLAVHLDRATRGDLSLATDFRNPDVF